MDKVERRGHSSEWQQGHRCRMVSVRAEAVNLVSSSQRVFLALGSIRLVVADSALNLPD
jgi:hypothetical protein